MTIRYKYTSGSPICIGITNSDKSVDLGFRCYPKNDTSLQCVIIDCGKSDALRKAYKVGYHKSDFIRMELNTDRGELRCFINEVLSEECVFSDIKMENISYKMAVSIGNTAKSVKLIKFEKRLCM